MEIHQVGPFLKCTALLMKIHPVKITYKTPNIYSEEERCIGFFSDPPHLIKTTRNCLSNSGMNKCSRHMWNDDISILWSYISQMYYEDVDFAL